MQLDSWQSSSGKAAKSEHGGAQRVRACVTSIVSLLIHDDWIWTTMKVLGVEKIIV